MATSTSETPAEKLKALIGDIRVAMLTTLAADGSFHTRPMATQAPSSTDEIWFFTASHNFVTQEIDAIHEVGLSYSDPAHQRYVTLAGSARVIRDEAKARELWNPWVEAWFPRGPSDPNLRLICVSARKAEYWDASAHRMAMLFENVKVVLGAKPHLPESEHAAINLKP